MQVHGEQANSTQLGIKPPLCVRRQCKPLHHQGCCVLLILLLGLSICQVLSECPRISTHLLKCLSNNSLSPCGAGLYRCLIRQQRQELRLQSPASSEAELADVWAVRWQPFLLEALTSDVTLLQNNTLSVILPCTFQTFPSAVESLLASLQPSVQGHLYAWACIMSSHRATTGSSPWCNSTLGPTSVLGTTSALGTLQLALSSADDKVRLAALNLLCCSPKTREAPTAEEMSIIKKFVAQNLNCESSPFRQHLQAALRRFLVRIRDNCLVLVKGLKARKEGEAASTDKAQDVLEKGTGETEDLLPHCINESLKVQCVKFGLINSVFYQWKLNILAKNTWLKLCHPITTKLFGFIFYNNIHKQGTFPIIAPI